MGTSTEGRAIPLVLVADSPRVPPPTARRSGKAIVYVQANIHGGEVEGKEVALELLRGGALAPGVRRPRRPREPHRPPGGE